MIAKSRAKLAIEWVAKDPDNRTDAAAARHVGLASASSIGKTRAALGVGRDGKLIIKEPK